MTDREIVSDVRAALALTRQLLPRRDAIAVTVQDSHVTLEGEVTGIAGKRRAVEAAAGCPGVRGVTDRLRLAPAERMGDGAIRDHIRDALLGEPSFHRHGLMLLGSNGSPESLRSRPPGAEGNFLLHVENGEVTLEGHVESLSHRRLAEVLAWWVPGTVQVLNHLTPVPVYSGHDQDGELEELIRIVLEKDRLVNADQILVRSGNARVVLSGTVPSFEQREIAEHDVWFVEGVKDLVNELHVP